MLEEGCFKALLDVQCFDLKAVESIRSNPKHTEVSATQYAGVSGKSAGVDNLDVVLLGATQVDLDLTLTYTPIPTAISWAVPAVTVIPQQVQNWLSSSLH